MKKKKLKKWYITYCALKTEKFLVNWRKATSSDINFPRKKGRGKYDSKPTHRNPLVASMYRDLYRSFLFFFFFPKMKYAFTYYKQFFKDVHVEISWLFPFFFLLFPFFFSFLNFFSFFPFLKKINVGVTVWHFKNDFKIEKNILFVYSIMLWKINLE